ncbi:hypothetical protein [Symbiobacterium thermophilum]|uniref:Uncharacterized protein n=1 Tax=Symbiobacterium thermophilum (strain DSM 24528 / JCM 14929 / IAM 14863 / T) TaxID=292459 RepID=Q67MZ2_SYMTH|nr:hypothetical protein [Symbiobacterium thermophilum]BAD40951.1 hypothetical protein STH1966 [Symbiobacterium thermophilum IAM 14863]
MVKWIAGLVALAVAVGAAIWVGYSRGHGGLPAVFGSLERSVAIRADYQVYTTLEELVEEASVIAVGMVEGVEGTRNLARDPDNPDLPHPSLEIIGYDYRFVVEEYLKGDGPDTILVTEARKFLSHGREGIPAEPPAPEMESGGRYILFLNRAADAEGRWIGVAEPWRFALRDAEVQVESMWEAAPRAFPSVGEGEFVDQIRTLVSAL